MSLPSGYIRLEYIQSTGTQYIDTLVNIEENKPITLRVVCDCSFNNAGVGNGVGTTIPGNIFYFGTYNGSYCYGLGNVDGVTSVAADTERRIYDLDAVGKKLTISDKLSLTGLSFATPTASRTFWLPQWGQGIKLYSCQIYDNGTLARDFIPCQTTYGTIGLWDDVNSVFYGNAGTGTFTAGPEIKGANKTLIYGTGYDVKAGKCLVGGTAYAVKKGRTLIDGTEYEIGFAELVSLNWFLNSTISLPTSTLYGSFTVPGDSDGVVFTKIEQRYLSGIYHLVYATESITEYVYAGGYLNQWSYAKYRTLNFLEEPTGDMLAWLEQNGVPQ